MMPRPYHLSRLFKTFGLVCLFVTTCYAFLPMELLKASPYALPIGIDTITGNSNPIMKQKIRQLIAHDFYFSGHFITYPEPTQITKQTKTKYPPSMHYLIQANLEATALNQDELTVTLLKKTASEWEPIKHWNYQLNSDNQRTIGHQASNALYEAILKRKGFFSGRLAYVLVKHNPTTYQLSIADYDGEQNQVIATSNEPILSPSWSHNGRYLVYTAYHHAQAQTFIYTAKTQQIQMISALAGMIGQASFSPDDQTIACTLPLHGTPKIHLFSLKDQQLTPLTKDWTLEAEPWFNHSGNALYFTANRQGSVQVFRYNLNTKATTRVSFQGDYNAHPRSNANRTLLWLQRHALGNTIAIKNQQDEQTHPFTTQEDNQSPLFARQGRWIMYTSQYAGRHVISLSSLDGKVTLRMPAQEGDIQQPTWLD
jgi:TolB protein